MKRTEIKRGKGLARGESTLKQTRLASRSEKKQATIADPALDAAREAWHRATLADGVCACCGLRGQMHGHHAVSRQHVRKRGGDEWDLRNRLSLRPACHMAHHAGRKIDQSKLRPENVAFARELLGEAAQEYLDRHYSQAPSER